jgi:hypothetical protein
MTARGAVVSFQQGPCLQKVARVFVTGSQQNVKPALASAYQAGTLSVWVLSKCAEKCNVLRRKHFKKNTENWSR